MADAVTTQVLHNNERNLVIKFTNISDATGEAAVTKVDPATYGYTATSLRIMRITYSTVNMSVQILWDATADVLAWALPKDITDTIDFTKFGGIANNAGAGVTGNIQFTTAGAAIGSSYSIVLEMAKS